MRYFQQQFLLLRCLILHMLTSAVTIWNFFFQSQAPPPDAMDQLRAELAEKCRLLDERSQADSTATAQSAQSNARLETDLQQMTVIAQQWQAEAARYQQFAEQWQQYQIAQVRFELVTAIEKYFMTS